MERKLIILGTSPSMSAPWSMQVRRERYTAEAALSYSGRIYVPCDLEVIDLNEACGLQYP